MGSSFNSFLRSALRSSAWVMAPLCLGLVAALLLLLAQFLRELVHAFVDFPQMTGPDVVLGILKLVDLVLLGNLVIMITIAGIDIFAPHASGQNADARPEWAGVLGFAGLKPRLFASITAIAAIDLLESFVKIDAADKSDVLWEVVLLLTFVATGAVLTWMEKAGADHH